MALFKFDFPETPAGSLGELWRALVKLLPQVEPRSTTIKNVTVATVETPVAHGLKRVPSFYAPLAHSQQTVYQSKNPDDRFVYLIASGSCVCDVKVWP